MAPTHGGRRANQTGRPRKPDAERLKATSVGLNADERARLKHAAKAQRVTMTDVLRALVRTLPDPPQD